MLLPALRPKDPKRGCRIRPSANEASRTKAFRAGDKIAQVSALAGVRATAEQAVGRVLHLQRTDAGDLLAIMEIWAPIAG